MRDDFLIFTPDDVDLSRSPLRATLDARTFVLGAFNPGMTRLASGNLLLMVRVAEALAEPVAQGKVRAIRWTPDGYALDGHACGRVDMDDPRAFRLKDTPSRLMGLTSLSWLLPVELDPTGEDVLAVHYDRAIAPFAAWQHYGLEDARISRIGDGWWMTICTVSAERHATMLMRSADGLNWVSQGLVLDHQNKDMLLFEGTPGGMYHALTRPLGDGYFVYPADSGLAGGPAIHFARSPDALHWKPLEAPGIRPRAGSRGAMKLGGGTPPVLTERGWLALYHGVEPTGGVGIYRTFWALFDRNDPTRILHVGDDEPLIEGRPVLTEAMAGRRYLSDPVVFSTGIADGGDHWIVASGEADLACRITRVAKDRLR
ncbi:glycoside hydrolase family 130 protein [Sphingomonas sp.]